MVADQPLAHIQYTPKTTNQPERKTVLQRSEKFIHLVISIFHVISIVAPKKGTNSVDVYIFFEFYHFKTKYVGLVWDVAHNTI